MGTSITANSRPAGHTDAPPRPAPAPPRTSPRRRLSFHRATDPLLRGRGSVASLLSHGDRVEVEPRIDDPRQRVGQIQAAPASSTPGRWRSSAPRPRGRPDRHPRGTTILLPVVCRTASCRPRPGPDCRQRHRWTGSPDGRTRSGPGARWCRFGCPASPDPAVWL